MSCREGFAMIGLVPHSRCTIQSAGPHLPRRPGSPRGLFGAGLVALLLLAPPAAVALPVDLVLDPTRSGVVPPGGPVVPLAGRLRLDLGTLPPVPEPTALAIVDLDVTGEGLAATLNPDLASPGLGVLRPDGTFLVPALFVRMDLGSGPIDQTLVDVEGTLRADASCAPLASPCLETSLAVDTLGPDGGVGVEIAAAVPEAGLGWLLLPAVAVGWARGRARGECREEDR